jgi:hypothetical protein
MIAADFERWQLQPDEAQHCLVDKKSERIKSRNPSDLLQKTSVDIQKFGA